MALETEFPVMGARGVGEELAQDGLTSRVLYLKGMVIGSEMAKLVPRWRN
jgi:hypothetical protein